MGGTKKTVLWLSLAFCLAAGCVDLTPPRQFGPSADSGDVRLRAIESDAGSKNTGGASGNGGRGGPDTLGPYLDASSYPAIEAGVDARADYGVSAPAEAGVFDSADGVRLPGDIRVSDLPDGHIEDASVTSTGGAEQGGVTGNGGSPGSGGATGTRRSPGSGGMTATGGGGVTGSGGVGGSGPIDSASSCAGRSGSDADPRCTLAQGLVAYYPCEQARSISLPDSSGNSTNAILRASVTGETAGYGFAAGKVGNALVLTAASKGYGALPAGILAGAKEATIATWVNIKTQVDWQRVWDFGKDSNVYMYLTTRSGYTKMPRFEINIGGNGQGIGIDGHATFPVGEWHHMAVILGPSGGTLYIDGLQAGMNASITLRPADLGDTPNNFIGRSQVADDPYLDGSIDEFRVYNRALSPREVQALYTNSSNPL
jgi:hypothetical protein